MGIVFINSHECHVCVTVGYLSVYAHLCTSVCVFMCVCMCVCARVCVCVLQVVWDMFVCLCVNGNDATFNSS